MTNPPDRVWVTMDRDKFPRAVNDSLADAKRDEDDLNQFNRSPRFGGPYVTHEYRLHRPIQWRTGVPDAETVERCGNRFAVKTTDGSIVLGAIRLKSLPLKNYWHWAPKFSRNSIYMHDESIAGWCPEDEMPEGGA